LRHRTQSLNHAHEADEFGAVAFRITAPSTIGQFGDLAKAESVYSVFTAQPLAESCNSNRKALLDRCGVNLGQRISASHRPLDKMTVGFAGQFITQLDEG